MFVLIFFTLILLYVFNNFYWKRRNYPPGPTPLPLVGNLPQLIKHLPGYNAFLEWHKEFDGIFTFWNAETPVVIVTDYDLIQKHFIKDAETFSGRQNIGQIDEYFKGGKYGIVFTDGEKWKEQRRFALHVLRDLGMSRPIMEQKIMLELEHFTEMIDEKLGTNKTVQIDMIPIIEVTVANIINQILFGFAHHDSESCQKFAKLKDLISEHMATVMQPFFAVSVQAPNFFEKLPYFKEPLIEFRQQYDEIAKYLTEQIENHKKNMNFDGEFTDFVDAYLKEMKKGQEYYTQKQLTCILYDLWIGGQETTAYTTIYSLICALNFPKTLQKIHEELDKFGTKNRKVTLADKQNLVYCQAFINETQRLINLLPMNLNHRVTKDTIIKGYKIKENTVIIPQISCVLFDERYFPDPMSFKPERFIDENGQVKKIEQFIPFSIGKRQCLGESLGKMELFLIITNFFNSYSIRSDMAPSMEKDPGCTVRPRHFKCNIQKRV